MNRRLFLGTGLAAAAAAAAAGGATVQAVRAAHSRRPRVLVRSAWQSVNIGDIAHTPGALALLQRHFPEAEVTLWPRHLEFGAREMIAHAFPNVPMVDGVIDKNGQPSTPALSNAFAHADIMVHASAAHFSASADFAAWKRITGKPYGVLGISMDHVSGIGSNRTSEGGTLAELRAAMERLPGNNLEPDFRALLEGAAFIYCRDSISLDYLRRQHVKTPTLEFGPDTVFGFQLRDEPKAAAYLREHQLEPRRFVCVIPRLRYTPYHRMPEDPRYSPGGPRSESDRTRDAINARHAESDHARLRDLIVRAVRNGGLRVLVCPEMTYQIQTAKEFVFDPLPDDVKRQVVWRDRYWLPNEAASVYAQSLAVVGIEPHSLIITLAAGVPALHLRQPTDTMKGHMFRDIGLPEWLFEIDHTTGEQLWTTIAAIKANPNAARDRVRAAMARINTLQTAMIGSVWAAVRS